MGCCSSKPTPPPSQQSSPRPQPSQPRAAERQPSQPQAAERQPSQPQAAERHSPQVQRQPTQLRPPPQAWVDGNFDAKTFCDRMHDSGKVYRCRATELIKICRSFAAAEERLRSIDQDTELPSVLESCDRAIRPSVRSPNVRACPELNELFEIAIRDSNQYNETFHRGRVKVQDMMIRARQDDERNMYRRRDQSQDSTLIVVDFHILPTLDSQNPTVVRQALSVGDGDSVMNELLWNFSHFRGNERLSLAQNPRFYTDLPTSLDGYDALFSSRPTKSFCNHDTIYVLIKSTRRIVFELGQSMRAFDNIWNMNDILIFRDVVGNIEGETSLEGSIRGSPHFTYRTRRGHENFLSWGDILRRLRDEAQLSDVHITGSISSSIG